MPKIKNKDQRVELTPALRVWAKRRNLRPSDFSRAMDWSPSYAWEVLRGKHTFSLEAHGRFIQVYGISALVEIYKIAKINPEPEQNGNH